MKLEQFGWNDFFAQLCARSIAARVVAARREHFVVWTEAGEVNAEPSGALRFDSPSWPAVGDWVELRDDGPTIARVLERRTTLSRRQPGRKMREQVLAANIDVLFVVSGLDRDYNPRRIERYLVVARQSGARPVILLNKADLADELGFDVVQVVRQTAELADGVKVIPVSGLARIGLDAIGAELAMSETAVQTAAMIGSSGAGKSTILNRLLGEDRQRTSAVRTGDDRGRHTTTARELFLMPGGWLLIDMPGLREVQLWASPDELDVGFSDVEALAARCRFRDCVHAGEPGCAVLSAVNDSRLDAARLANYHKMRRELDYLERKANPEHERQTRAKWKAIHKAMRRDMKRDS